MKTSKTPGGNQLRTLRESRGQSQFDVELEASLGIGYLQRVESGKVSQPERSTLDRILAALGARYTERRSILEMFGYLVDAPLPTEDEIAWAIRMCQADLDSAVFPVYLIDCAAQMLTWNSLVPKLFLINDAPNISLHRASMITMVFDSPLTPRIVNANIFLSAQIRAFRYEMQHFQGEGWVTHLIDEMRRNPLFETYWTQEVSHPQSQTAARPLAPLHLKFEAETLQFRLLSESFVQDRRFRVIYYLPGDAKATQQCLEWLQE